VITDISTQYKTKRKFFKVQYTDRFNHFFSNPKSNTFENTFVIKSVKNSTIRHLINLIYQLALASNYNHAINQHRADLANKISNTVGVIAVHFTHMKCTITGDQLLTFKVNNQNTFTFFIVINICDMLTFKF